MTHFVALPLTGTLAVAYLATSLHRPLRFDVADRWLVATVIARVAVAGSPERHRYWELLASARQPGLSRCSYRRSRASRPRVS